MMDLKKKKFIEDEFDKFKDFADVNPDSDLPISEKKAKEKRTKDMLDENI